MIVLIKIWLLLSFTFILLFASLYYNFSSSSFRNFCNEMKIRINRISTTTEINKLYQNFDRSCQLFVFFFVRSSGWERNGNENCISIKILQIVQFYVKFGYNYFLNVFCNSANLRIKKIMTLNNYYLLNFNIKSLCSIHTVTCLLS